MKNLILAAVILTIPLNLKAQASHSAAAAKIEKSNKNSQKSKKKESKVTKKAKEEKAMLKAFKALCPITIADMKANIVFQLQPNGRSKGPDDLKGRWSLKEGQLVIHNKGNKPYKYSVKAKGDSFLINKASADKDSPSHWIVNSDFN